MAGGGAEVTVTRSSKTEKFFSLGAAGAAGAAAAAAGAGAGAGAGGVILMKGMGAMGWGAKPPNCCC